ncbi:MAG: ABC transporter substrate-binding protein [Actinomycetota bacterium]
MRQDAAHVWMLQRRVTRRRFLAGAGLGLAGVALSACTGGSNEPTTRGSTPPGLGGRDPRTLVVAVDAAIENLDPATNVEWAYGLQPVYDTLVKLDGTSTEATIPWLAESLESNADATVWTARLRQGVTFHDGTELDANAVKEAITRTATQKGGLGYVWAFDDPDGQMTVEDPLTLRFSFPYARPFFNVETSGQYGFWIPSPTAARQHSEGPADQGHEWLQANPVGTGPYTVTRNDPGQEIVFERFDGYWGGWSGDHFDRVITRTIPESSTRRQLLEQGEADITWAGTADDTIELGEDPRFVVTDAPTLVMEYVALGSYGPLADPRARQGLNHAFDRKGYLEGVMLGTLDEPHGVFPDLLATADTSIQAPAYDLQKAKQLLDAAGVTEGTELSYEYFTGFGDDVGELLQASLAEIGINLRLVERSFSAFVADYFSDAPPEQRSNMYFFSWWPNYNHPFDWAWVLYHSDAGGSAGGNAGLYSNKEADGLIDAMWNAPIDADLESTSSRVQEILTVEDPAWIPVAQEPTHLYVRNDVGGLILNPVYVLTLDMYQLHRTPSQGG